MLEAGVQDFFSPEYDFAKRSFEWTKDPEAKAWMSDTG